MRRILILVALAATPALADPVVLKPSVDVRLRYEHADQAGLLDADAVTLRMRPGVEAATRAFAVLIEAEGTLAISQRYNSLVNGKTAFAPVADPQNIELNRAQVQLRAIPKTLVTVGRQRIILDDQRFVGNVGWRQNEQTFDAARLEWASVKNLKLDLSYAWSNRTIYGVDGFGARPSSIRGDNVFANAAFKHRLGQLTGFAYLVDQDDFAVQGYRLSSQTYGGRYTSGFPLSKAVKLNVAASYARQSHYHRNPNNYAVNYYLGELGVGSRGVTVAGGYEVLGADGGAALTSFQTPLATLHKFNGWADKFLVTPPNGLRDAYASLGYARSKVAGFDSVGATALVHDFRSDRLDQHYGREVDLLLTAKHKRFNYLVKLAHYDARGFATNTTKLWGSIEWAY